MMPWASKTLVAGALPMPWHCVQPKPLPSPAMRRLPSEAFGADRERGHAGGEPRPQLVIELAGEEGLHPLRAELVADPRQLGARLVDLHFLLRFARAAHAEGIVVIRPGLAAVRVLLDEERSDLALVILPGFGHPLALDAGAARHSCDLARGELQRRVAMK